LFLKIRCGPPFKGKKKKINFVSLRFQFDTPVPKTNKFSQNPLQKNTYNGVSKR